MQFAVQDTYPEELRKFATVTEMWAFILTLKGKAAPSLTRLASAASRTADRLGKEGPDALEEVLREEFSKVFPKAPSNRKVDHDHLAEIGRDGGLNKSKRKRMSSRRNGMKGGRPSPDLKTRTSAERLYQLLLERSPLAWSNVANYRWPPRILKYLEVLLIRNGIPKARVGLPEIWSSVEGSADPIKPNADAARKHECRFGYYSWPEKGPRQRKYSDAVFTDDPPASGSNFPSRGPIP